MTGRNIRVHAICVALPDAGDGWSGVLLRGPSGAGKSDLVLRLIDGGARLVADDQTELRCVDGVLTACAPQSLAGKIEVRGVGIMELPYLDVVSLVLVCDLTGQSRSSVFPVRRLFLSRMSNCRCSPWRHSRRLRRRSFDLASRLHVTV